MWRFCRGRQPVTWAPPRSSIARPRRYAARSREDVHNGVAMMPIDSLIPGLDDDDAVWLEAVLAELSTSLTESPRDPKAVHWPTNATTSRTCTGSITRTRGITGRRWEGS